MIMKQEKGAAGNKKVEIIRSIELTPEQLSRITGGAAAVNTDIMQGGTQTVASGGTATITTMNGGTQNVANGGT